MLLLLVALIYSPPLFASHVPKPSHCELALGRLVTADAEPGDLIAVVQKIWPATRPVVLRLEQIVRRGFALRGVPHPQSVLEHILDVVTAVRHYARSHPIIDVRRAMWMALVHDFAEALIGDIAPADGVPPEKKFALESEAWDTLIERAGPDFKFFKDLWLELEAHQTAEARAVHQLDKLDAVVRAAEYAREGYATEDFFDSIRPHLTETLLMDLVAEIEALRHDPSTDLRTHYLARLSGAPAPF